MLITDSPGQQSDRFAGKTLGRFLNARFQVVRRHQLRKTACGGCASALRKTPLLIPAIVCYTFK